MNKLLEKKCVPCEGGVVPFDISEIHKYQKMVDGWNIIKDKKDIYFLEKLSRKIAFAHLPYGEQKLFSFLEKKEEVGQSPMPPALR